MTHFVTGTSDSIQYSAAFRRYLSRRTRHDPRRQSLHRLDNWFRILRTTAHGQSENCWMPRLELLKELRSIDTVENQESRLKKDEAQPNAVPGQSAGDTSTGPSSRKDKWGNLQKRRNSKSSSPRQQSTVKKTGRKHTEAELLELQRSSSSVISGVIAAGKMKQVSLVQGANIRKRLHTESLSVIHAI